MTQPVSSVTAVLPKDTVYTVNDSDVKVVDGRPSLLVDEIVSTDNSASGSDYRGVLVDKAVKLVGEGFQNVATQAKYLDLVDAANGNTWIQTDSNVTIYWPYPQGTDANTKFRLVHFDGLDREMTADEVMDAINKNEPVVVKDLVTDQYGIRFETDSFSPFVLVWDNTQTTTVTEEDDHPDIAEAIANGTWGQPTPTPAPAVVPQTGDNMPVMLLVILAVVAAGAIVVLVVVRKGDPKEAVNVANLIVSDPTVIAGMGSFSSSCAMAAAPVFEEADLLLFSPNASHTDFPAMGENMFSAVMSQKYEGAEFADALIEMFGAQNVAILYQNTDHGVIATDVFTKQYEAGGGKVIMSETFIPGQTKDFSPVLSRIKEQDPDLFYVNASYNDCAQIFMQAKALNMDCQLVGPGMLLTEEFLDVVGNKIDGTIVMSSVPAFLPSVLESGELDAASKNFVDSYTAEYNEVPDGFAASAFDAVNIVLDAVAKVGTDTPALREELKTLRDYPGVSGYNMSFNEQKEMVKGIYLFEIQDGQFVRVK